MKSKINLGVSLFLISNTFQQSQSSLSGAQAGYIGAQNNIITSKLAYENIIGPINTDENLKKIYNSEVPIPSSLVEAKKYLNKKVLILLLLK